MWKHCNTGEIYMINMLWWSWKNSCRRKNSWKSSWRKFTYRGWKSFYWCPYQWREFHDSYSDVGLHGPCNYDENRRANQLHGVLPYIAPGALRGKNHSAASDVYSFGIMMNTLATGKRLLYNRARGKRCLWW